MTCEKGFSGHVRTVKDQISLCTHAIELGFRRSLTELFGTVLYNDALDGIVSLYKILLTVTVPIYPEMPLFTGVAHCFWISGNFLAELWEMTQKSRTVYISARARAIV